MLGELKKKHMKARFHRGLVGKDEISGNKGRKKIVIAHPKPSTAGRVEEGALRADDGSMDSKIRALASYDEVRVLAVQEQLADGRRVGAPEPGRHLAGGSGGVIRRLWWSDGFGDPRSTKKGLPCQDGVMWLVFGRKSRREAKLI